MAFLLFFVSGSTQAPHWAGVPFYSTGWEEDWVFFHPYIGPISAAPALAWIPFSTTYRITLILGIL